MRNLKIDYLHDCKGVRKNETKTLQEVQSNDKPPRWRMPEV